MSQHVYQLRDLFIYRLLSNNRGQYSTNFLHRQFAFSMERNYSNEITTVDCTVVKVVIKTVPFRPIKDM